MIEFNVQTGEIFEKNEDITEVIEEILPTPTLEQRIADMEAEIARLKSELNVQ